MTWRTSYPHPLAEQPDKPRFADKIAGALSGILTQKNHQLIGDTQAIQREIIAEKTGVRARTLDRCTAECVKEKIIERRGRKKSGGYSLLQNMCGIAGMMIINCARVSAAIQRNVNDGISNCGLNRKVPWAKENVGLRCYHMASIHEQVPISANSIETAGSQ